jgi:SAM-dependent methyltransferase
VARRAQSTVRAGIEPIAKAISAQPGMGVSSGRASDDIQEAGVVIDGYSFAVGSASKFHHSIYISGWFHHPNDRLASVSLAQSVVLHEFQEVGIPHGVDADLGRNKGFMLQALMPTNQFPEDLALRLTTERGWQTTVRLRDLIDEIVLQYTGSGLAHRFRNEILNHQLRVLDIGGRARSGVDRRQHYPGADYTVLDILPGDNVDVVGDAHELSRLFPPEHFGAVVSVSVFEHLLVPWKVVLEINKVLKPGGIGLISTHQTLGLHDLPWDFWRYSDHCWPALFNERTGFEIVETITESLQYVIPFLFTPDKQEAERSAGHEGTAVVFRKIGPAQEVWGAGTKDLISTMYPGGQGRAPSGSALGAESFTNSAMLAAELRTMRNSRSWRMTKPLRAMSRFYGTVRGRLR